MKRVYFLVPNVRMAGNIVDELLLARIEERHIHVIAKDGTPLGSLPEAGILEKSDFYPALQRGVAVGGATGILAGLLAVTFPPAGLALGGGAILATALLGSGFGVWFSTMIGTDVPNTRHERFRDAIERGEVLMLVDVPKRRVAEIEELVQKHHRSAEIQGVEPTIPAFP